MLMRREEGAQKELVSMDSYVAGRHPLWGFHRDIEHMIRLCGCSTRDEGLDTHCPWTARG